MWLTVTIQKYGLILLSASFIVHNLFTIKINLRKRE